MYFFRFDELLLFKKIAKMAGIEYLLFPVSKLSIYSQPTVYPNSYFGVKGSYHEAIKRLTRKLNIQISTFYLRIAKINYDMIHPHFSLRSILAAQ